MALTLKSIALALIFTSTGAQAMPRLSFFAEAPALGTGMLLAQAGAELPADPLEKKSLAELHAEYDRLDRSRPKIFPPIIMLAGGVVACLPGALFTFIGLGPHLPGVTINPVFGNGVAILIVGIALLAVGITFAIIGGVTLGPTMKKRREIGDEMTLVENRITELEPPNDEDLPSNRGRVRLTVVDKKTGAPLPNATIKIGGHTLWANDQGQVLTGVLPPGPVSIEVSMLQYSVASEAVMIVGGQTAQVALSLLADRDREPGTVTGIIRSVEGGERQTAKIFVAELNRETSAGADGTFFIQLPAGKYTVTITSKGFASQTRPLEVKWGDRTILNVDLHKERR